MTMSPDPKDVPRSTVKILPHVPINKMVHDYIYIYILVSEEGPAKGQKYKTNFKF